MLLGKHALDLKIDVGIVWRGLTVYRLPKKSRLNSIDDLD